jgi:chemotaxis signal transduction protein
LKDAEFVSHLLVDLLDRNLYERSDDCRWWALTPELRTALASAKIDASTLNRITDILEYINALYTVYTRIFVYDSTGHIIASSNPANEDSTIVGSKIDDITLSQVMLLQTDQQYYVTPFQPNILYDDAPTYVYHAAIMMPEGEKVVGGIGIVFNSTPEFQAMLRGGIAEKETVKAYYIDRNAKIIASTDATRPAGSILDLDADLLTLPNGKSASRIVTHDGHYSIMGCSASHGYREFKVTDGYIEDVIAVVFDSFGEIRNRPALGSNATVPIETESGKSDGVEFATFSINGGLFAIEAAYVTEALAASEVSPVSIGSSSERVGILSIQNESENKTYAWVFDLGYLLSGVPSIQDNSGQVVVIKYGQHKIGLLVEALHTVAEFTDSQINVTPISSEKNSVLIKQIIKANGGKLLIQGIDIAYLLKMLSNPFAEFDLDKHVA